MKHQGIFSLNDKVKRISVICCKLLGSLKAGSCPIDVCSVQEIFLPIFLKTVLLFRTCCYQEKSPFCLCLFSFH